MNSNDGMRLADSSLDDKRLQQHFVLERRLQMLQILTMPLRSHIGLLRLPSQLSLQILVVETQLRHLPNSMFFEVLLYDC